MAVAGLELDVVLPVAGDRLVVALNASLTRPSSSGVASDPRIGGTGEYDLDVTELMDGTRAGPGSALERWAGAGAGRGAMSSPVPAGFGGHSAWNDRQDAAMMRAHQ